MLGDFDLKDFWKDSAESKKNFICKDASTEDIKKCEEKLGFKLPDSYIALMKGHNGGMLGRNVFQKRDTNGKIVKSMICEFLNAIGDEKTFSLLADWSKWTTEGYDKGILIGLHMPDSGYGKKYYLDYSICGNLGEPRVICHTRVWRDNHARHVEFELADTFEDFIKGLVKAPKIAAFDFDYFNSELKHIAKVVFSEGLREYSDETVDSFGIYTDDEGSFVAFAFNTKEHFEALAQKELNDKEFYKYSTANWKYEDAAGNDNIAKLSERLVEYTSLLLTDASIKNFRNKLIDNCVLCLEDLRRENYFREIGGRDIVLMVNLTTDELPKAKLKKIASQLNT